MSSRKTKAKRIIPAVGFTLVLFLVSYYIADYGLPISVAISLLFLPYLIAVLLPRKEVLNFYGKHLQWITIVIFIALPAVWTIVLYGIIGILLLFELPIIFVQAPPLLAIILTDIGVLLCHRVFVYRIVKEENHPESVMCTVRMTDKIVVYFLVSFIALVLLVYALGKFNLSQPIGYLSWLLAFVFWSYFFIVPISVSIANSHKQTRFCLMVATQAFATENTGDDKRLEKRLFRLAWLRTGVNTYNELLSTQPNHPSLVNVNSYYDAAYSALLAGTINDRKRILTSLKNMLEALGKNKKENDFTKFLRALVRIKKSGRITWENIAESIKTESKIERTLRKCKPLIIYLVPLVSLIVQIILELLKLG
jgi:hypothetical protein